MKRLCLVIAGWLLGIGLAIGQVNINTAGQDELDGLKGIGPSKAKAIVDYRRKNGPFKSIDELEKVPGIGPATLQELRADVTVGGASRSRNAASTGPVETTVPARPSAKPVVQAPASGVPDSTAKPAAPARPALPGKPPVAGQAAAPAAVPAAPAAPARPAMPAKPSTEAKPASVKPAAPAVPSSASKPATPAVPVSKPAMPAAPAKPAQPARPAAVN